MGINQRLRALQEHIKHLQFLRTGTFYAQEKEAVMWIADAEEACRARIKQLQTVGI